MGMGVAGMIITSDYGSFPHSLLSTSKVISIYFDMDVPTATYLR